MEQMKTHFNTVEQNPKLKTLVDKYEQELAAITGMVTFFNSHPCIGFWYTYWSDIFKHNGDLPGIKDNEALFNPSVSTSICFKPMGRAETEEYLKTCEGDDDPLGKNQAAHLDLLFEKVDAIKIKHPMNGGGKKGRNSMFNPASNHNLNRTDTGSDIHTDPATGNKYKQNSETGETEWLTEEELQMTEMKNSTVVAAPADVVVTPVVEDDGSSVWVGFAKSPVAETANPGNVTIVDGYSGSAVWVTK